MADALVAADFDLATDVSLYLAAEVTLDLPGAFNNVTKSSDLLISEVVGAQVWGDSGLLEKLLGTGWADSVDVGESDFHTLVAWEVNTS